MELLIRDGKEQHLLMLCDLYDTSIMTGEIIQGCASCFQVIQICTCKHSTRWPLEHVINKLRAELHIAG